VRGEDDLSASVELEKLASKYAGEAINMDRQGSAEMAITRYQRAVEILLKLSTLYPNSPQKKIYVSRVKSYRKRVEELRGGSSRIGGTDSSNRTLNISFNELVIAEKPNVYWDYIANLSVAKKVLEETLIFPVKRPDLFPLGWPRGILFYGPPGCGKTLLASAVATEIAAVFYCVDSASLMSKWLGESEKNVAKLFQEAREQASKGQSAVIFLDEIDSIIGKRISEVGGEVRTRNQFLKEMDGVLDKKRKLHVYVIGATNKPWELDDAFIRRFQKRIYVPLPAYDARLEMLRIYTKNLKVDKEVELEGLATETDGYSGSDIRDIVQAAHIKAVRDFFENGDPEDKRTGPRKIEKEDFQGIIDKRKPSVPKTALRNFDSWSKEFNAL
jgi:SpoVK/Ycf46/Vps4 family AAA+-type ATPase